MGHQNIYVLSTLRLLALQTALTDAAIERLPITLSIRVKNLNLANGMITGYKKPAGPMIYTSHFVLLAPTWQKARRHD